MRALLFILIVMPCMLMAQHTNIMISDQQYPEEPSIYINPKNTNQIVAGANIFNVYYSNDGGLTWTISTMTSSYGVWGDPCIITDTTGAFYFFHLSNPPAGSWIDRIVCQRLDTFGGTWNWTDGSYMGLNGGKEQDKEWAVVDWNNNNIYVTWTEFDHYGSAATADSSRIMFSKSTDQGDTWSTAKQINQVSGDCIDSDSTTEGAVPAVGPNGEIYVSWAGPAGLVFDRSLDGGDTWLENDIFIDSFPGGWDLTIPGINRCNGLPVTVCDLSNGPHHGTIYVNWTDQRNGETDTDVWLVKSTDGGNTWSQPARVNDDGPGKHQFFTWMTVDQVTGHLWFIFYDRRAYSDNQTDVYMAVSKDGGATFTNFKISDSPFTPNPSVFFGDYNNISAHNGMVRPIWTRLNNGNLSVWTAIVDTSATDIAVEDLKPENTFISYPNPFDQSTWIKIKLSKETKVSLHLFDMQGRLISTIIDEKILPIGRHLEKINADELQLKPGVYFVRLTYDDKVQLKKIVCGG